MRSKAESYFDINAMRAYFVTQDNEDTPRMLRHLARLEMDMIKAMRRPIECAYHYKVIE